MAATMTRIRLREYRQMVKELVRDAVGTTTGVAHIVNRIVSALETVGADNGNIMFRLKHRGRVYTLFGGASETNQNHEDNWELVDFDTGHTVAVDISTTQLVLTLRGL